MMHDPILEGRLSSATLLVLIASSSLHSVTRKEFPWNSYTASTLGVFKAPGKNSSNKSSLVCPEMTSRMMIFARSFLNLAVSYVNESEILSF